MIRSFCFAQISRYFQKVATFSHSKCEYCALRFIFVAFQELGELREAKKLLIQQKLELQGQVEAAQDSLQQEQKEHQATRDSKLQREEQFLAQTKDVQDKLVGPSAISL